MKHQNSCFSRKVNTVCLPIDSTIPNKGIVAGWGSTTKDKGPSSVKKLQYAELDIYSRSECQEKYDEILRGRKKIEISQKMTCAGNEKADACSGDHFFN